GVAKKLFLSQRRGYWVVPKYIGGEVLDARVEHPSKDPPWLSRVIPTAWMLSLAERRLVQATGRPEQYGLLAPDHRFLSTHPAVSQEIYIRLGSGDVAAKPNIRELRGRQVVFVDGTAEDIDVIIWCTGYKVSFPFFDEGFISAPGNEIA